MFRAGGAVFISPEQVFFNFLDVTDTGRARLIKLNRGSQEIKMPHYDYECKDCNTVESIKATIAEKEQGLDVSCSKCGSKNMEQVFSSMAVVSGGFSMPAIDSMPRASSGGGCGCGAGGCGSH